MKKRRSDILWNVLLVFWAVFLVLDTNSAITDKDQRSIYLVNCSLDMVWMMLIFLLKALKAIVRRIDFLETLFMGCADCRIEELSVTTEKPEGLEEGVALKVE